MWVVRILTGPLSGQSLPLKPGANILGRSEGTDVQIASAGVSKKHARIDIGKEAITITDLGSSNGTFVNGVKIKTATLSQGDKVSVHDVLFEVQPATATQIHQLQIYQPQQQAHGNYQQQQHQHHHHVSHANMAAFDGNAAHAYDPYSAPQEEMQPSSAKAKKVEGIADLIKQYMDDVVLPGVYKLPEWLEFRWVLGLFVFAFVATVTSLSSIPLVKILKDSVESESQSNALTIAKYLAEVNQPAIAQGITSSVTVSGFDRQKGVQQALVIDIDGQILAPAHLASQHPDEPWIFEARTKDEASVINIDDTKIVAVAPIKNIKPETGTLSVDAWAIIIYNMGELAINNHRTLSLLVQTFFIALVIGSVLFFFLYKVIEYPIISMNQQIDRGLQGERTNVHVDYDFPPLNKLASNITSALSRMSVDSNDHQHKIEYDRSQEMHNLVQLVGFPTIAISAVNNTIDVVNSDFADRIGQSEAQLLHSPVSQLTDQALKLSIEDLIDRSRQTPDQMISNEIEFSGNNFEIVCQSIYGLENVAYYLIILLPAIHGEEVI
ncbi:MAG: FHA domain-containing protein [Pseudobdellovibrionaceae bacterium]|nr:FHA domain-containing protein [Bdellovibrionales bacterium]USN47214.1 MAG: FHA domain-containing protein [Pseudobdellovibrionaceae bacterium]